MKSVFWIHSHITFLISVEIIKRHELKDVVIYLARKYKMPFKLECEKLEIYDAPFFRQIGTGNLLERKNPFKTRKNVRSCKQFYRKTIGCNPFELYIPTSFEHAIALLMNLRNCISYYYIEEGTAAYRCNPNTEKRNLIFRIISKYIYNIPPKSFYDIDSHFMGTIGFSDEAFRWSPQKEILELSLPGLSQYNYSHLLVLGPLFEESQSIRNKYSLICKYFNSLNITKVYFKFHPSSKMDPQKVSVINEIFKKSRYVSFEEIGENTILEYAFANTHSVIYSIDNISSVQVYLSKFQCVVKVLSVYSDKIDEHVTSFNEIISETCKTLKR